MVVHESEQVHLSTLPSGVEITTELQRYIGSEDGPTVYIQAAQHGREVNGIEVLRRFDEFIKQRELRGEILAIPLANPVTFDHVSYTAPDKLDSVNTNMNRVWPGDHDGSIHERMAATLWDIATEADSIIDLHTGSPNMMSHVVVTKGDEESLELARAFGSDLILCEPAAEEAEQEWHQRGFNRKLRVAAHTSGIPCITPEIAHNKEIVEDAVENGFKGLLSVLGSLDMLDSGVETNSDQTLARNHLGRITADDSGLFRPDPDKSVGDVIEEGDHIGTVYNPTTFEAIQEATADHTGILYSLRKEAIVTAGAGLFNIALELDEF